MIFNFTQPRFLGEEGIVINNSEGSDDTKYLRGQPGAKGDFLSGAAQNSYQSACQAIMNYA